MLDLGGIRWPQGLALYLPPEFEDKYRARHKGKSGPELVLQSATDLFFQHPEMTETLTDVHDEQSFGRHWKGRVYLWTLHKMVMLLTQRRGQGVFPSSAEGIGFDQWRSDFERLVGYIELLSDIRSNMIADHSKFIAENPTKWENMRLEEHYRRAVSMFFDAMRSARSRLNEIAKVEQIMSRYSFRERVHVFSLSFLTSFAVLLGMVVPLVLLALSKELTPSAAIALLVGTLAFIFASFIQFGWDVFRPPTSPVRNYVSNRWYVPMAAELERQASKLTNMGLIDTGYFQGARDSEDHRLFSKQVLETLDRYIFEASTYNHKAGVFNKSVLAAIRNDPTLSSFVDEEQRSHGGAIFYPGSILLDDGQWEALLDNLRRNKSDISVEVLMPRWSHVEFIFPAEVLQAEKSRFIESLKSLRASMKSTVPSGALSDTKAKVELAGKSLLEAINAAKSPT